MEHKTLFHLPVTTDVTCTAIVELLDCSIKNKNPLFATFINPHSFYLAKNNPNYLTYLKQFDAILPDGIAVKKAISYFLKSPVDRISFDSSSLALPVFEYCEKNNHSILLVGGQEGVAKKAAKIINTSFPNLNIAETLNGFTPQEELCGAIMNRNPDIVICGMGAPYQEELLLLLKNKGWQGVAFTCGGYFDQLSEGLHYYPPIIDKLNIRFLYRIYKEPGRLLKRYFIEYRVFIFQVLLAFFKLKRV